MRQYVNLKDAKLMDDPRGEKGPIAGVIYIINGPEAGDRWVLLPEASWIWKRVLDKHTETWPSGEKRDRMLASKPDREAGYYTFPKGKHFRLAWNVDGSKWREAREVDEGDYEDELQARAASAEDD